MSSVILWFFLSRKRPISHQNNMVFARFLAHLLFTTLSFFSHSYFFLFVCTALPSYAAALSHSILFLNVPSQPLLFLFPFLLGHIGLFIIHKSPLQSMVCIQTLMLYIMHKKSGQIQEDELQQKRGAIRWKQIGKCSKRGKSKSDPFWAVEHPRVEQHLSAWSNRRFAQWTHPPTSGNWKKGIWPHLK